ncbi:hypothetical protein AZF37_04175 [endosymbiont 'TC1' of Trimyema compressum]|nr:hypothetical protein AZF37_04175 [endosymbiont 'TC1' of Trimyema compressum]
MARAANREDGLVISKVLYKSWLLTYQNVFRKAFFEALKENRWVPFLNTMFENKMGTILVVEDKETIIGASIFGNSRDGI